jgi:hypothetical protein
MIYFAINHIFNSLPIISLFPNEETEFVFHFRTVESVCVDWLHRKEAQEPPLALDPASEEVELSLSREAIFVRFLVIGGVDRPQLPLLPLCLPRLLVASLLLLLLLPPAASSAPARGLRLLRPRRDGRGLPGSDWSASSLDVLPEGEERGRARHVVQVASWRAGVEGVTKRMLRLVRLSMDRTPSMARADTTPLIERQRKSSSSSLILAVVLRKQKEHL